jgi:hypothetical protein
MASKRKNKRSVLREDLSRPSKWRLQHGDFTAPIREADPETGRPVQHRYAIDTLAVMLNNVEKAPLLPLYDKRLEEAKKNAH